MEINVTDMIDMSQCYLHKYCKTDFKNYLAQLNTQSSEILYKFRLNILNRHQIVHANYS